MSSIARPLLKLRFLGRDRALLDIGERPTELRPRLAEILALLCAHPNGMSADALCADLHGDGGSVSSVRVEVSRLRKLLGPWIDTDRYRLTCDVETDVRRIEGLLAGGAVRDAAESYPGPLLPSSEAPGIVRERERLDLWLRQAVMTAEDADALWAWVHTPTGADDLGAWKRLLTQLEFRDPRRPLCVARTARAASCSADVTPGWSTGVGKSDPGRRTAGMQATRTQRGLSTARAALTVTWLLARAPDGVRADEVAETLGKSVSTAYNVLASLCDEGVAERRPRRPLPPLGRTSARPSPRARTATTSRGVVDDLLARTHKRAYLAVLRDGHLRVVLERGLQGMPKLPGMDPEIADNAHALALGKVVLALGPRDAVERYARSGLRRFTPATITDPDALLEELREVRLRGVADGARGVRAATSAASPRRCSTTSAGSSARSASPCPAERSRTSARQLEETLRDVVRIPTICG